MTVEFSVIGNELALIRGGRLLFEGLELRAAPQDGLHVSGPNGSGKSSLIRLVAGLLRPTSGALWCDRFALADEHVALDRELPLGRALKFWGGRRLDAALETFAIRHLIDVPVRLLSTGQLKRATLARVMASAATVWLLDEPLNGLDAQGVGCLDRALDTHRATGGVVIAASHQPLPGEWRLLELGQ